jgi:hypothetical protein
VGLPRAARPMAGGCHDEAADPGVLVEGPAGRHGEGQAALAAEVAHRRSRLQPIVQVEGLRSQLLVAINDGSRFDPANGLPVEWIRSDATWWTWSREWLGLKWPRWAGKTRSMAVETLVALTPHLVRPGAPEPPESLGDWLRASGYRPDQEPASASAELSWLD